jgi:hypothetical protein
VGKEDPGSEERNWNKHEVKENFGRSFRWLTVVYMPNNGGLLSHPALF